MNRIEIVPWNKATLFRFLNTFYIYLKLYFRTTVTVKAKRERSVISNMMVNTSMIIKVPIPS